MKALFKQLGLITAVIVVACAQNAFAGIVGSKHDFTTGGDAQTTTGLTDQVCVFCHTPHGSDTAAPVPLWNKVLTGGATYTRYSTLSTPSFDSAEAPVGSVSLACLSCHDGTQAMDVVINLPGSGGYNAAGQTIDPAIGVMTGSPIPNLQQDLTDDHPISMQYAGGGPLVSDPDGTYTGPLGDPDFVKPEKATVNSQPIWWLDVVTGTATVREKSDMILYARNDLGTVQPFVECGSCHDPHNEESSATGGVEFLRTANTASRICTSCHIK